MSRKLTDRNMAALSGHFPVGKVMKFAEIVAAIGGILSLVFVGFQLNEGNKEARAATVQASIDSGLSLMSCIGPPVTAMSGNATGSPR